jgi:hypothetical protein
MARVNIMEISREGEQLTFIETGAEWSKEGRPSAGYPVSLLP